ncbi:Olfactory Receptor 2T12, partial [Manis pentadactyla]
PLAAHTHVPPAEPASLMDMMFVCTTGPKMAADYLTDRKSISLTDCGLQIFVSLTLGDGERVFS